MQQRPLSSFNMQPSLSSFNMQRQPSLSSFNMQGPLSSFNAASLKNKMNQAAYNARRYVSGAAGSVTGAVNSFINPNNPNNPNAAAVKPNRFASSGSKGSGSGVVGDGEYQMFTRAQLNDLYGNNSGKRPSSSSSLMGIFNFGKGPVDSMIMMFQLYIALIASLSRLIENASSRGISLLFGNEALINLFSVFLENALNIILNKKVANMTLEQLHESLKANQPKLEQMSALLINAVSALAQGLSDICSKIAMEWVAKYLPGLLKSAALGASGAAQAGINAATGGAFDEVMNIFSASAAVVGAAMKVINALASSSEDFSKAFKTVKDAYDKIIKLKDIFSQSPSEIAAELRDVATSATAAVIPQSAKDFADTLTSKTLDLKRNPFLKVSVGYGQNGEPSSQLTQPSQSPSSQSPSSPSSPQSKVIDTLATSIKNDFGTAKDEASKLGINVKGLSDLAEKIKTNSKLALFLAQRFGMTVTGLQGSMLTRLADELEKTSGNPENASVRGLKFAGKNIRPIAAGLGKVSEHLDNASKFIYQGGSKSRDKNKMKSRKYLKNKKHLKRYMSNLRRKTAKKELDLLNGIRDFKSMIHL
jgi:hypothetical protein